MASRCPRKRSQPCCGKAARADILRYDAMHLRVDTDACLAAIEKMFCRAAERVGIPRFDSPATGLCGNGPLT